ncbi:hypothetical protein H5410_030484 [Solanum commersonii]|uniref:Uncharacterized protein n=1 Tax=Solanum commersonii TaxID=4109 RepID=A0A9J5YFT2_SOLCO|nr:hypothetical protein H5410_030484 [Solanum commersonii]
MHLSNSKCIRSRKRSDVNDLRGTGVIMKPWPMYPARITSRESRILWSFTVKEVGTRLSIIDYLEKSVKEISTQDLIVGPFSPIIIVDDNITVPIAIPNRREIFTSYGSSETIDIEDIENTLDYGVYTSAQPMTIHDSIIESIPYRFLEECYGCHFLDRIPYERQNLNQSFFSSRCEEKASYTFLGGVLFIYIYPNEPSMKSLQLMFDPEEKEKIFRKWVFMIR